MGFTSSLSVTLFVRALYCLFIDNARVTALLPCHCKSLDKVISELSKLPATPGVMSIRYPADFPGRSSSHF